jgi:hypothetical protein
MHDNMAEPAITFSLVASSIKPFGAIIEFSGVNFFARKNA